MENEFLGKLEDIMSNLPSKKFRMIFDIPTTKFTDGQQWEFKKIDAANDMIVAVSGGLIDGVASVSMASIYDAITVTYFNGDFYII